MSQLLDCVTTTSLEVIDPALLIEGTVTMAGIVLTVGVAKQPALQWSWTTQSNVYITGIQFEVGPSNFSSGIVKQDALKAALSTQITNGLLGGQNYTGRYRAVGDGVFGPWSGYQTAYLPNEWVSNGVGGEVEWGQIGGDGRPADNAGTSGLLWPIGSYSTVVGNSVGKALPGTHGSYQGGAVGSALVGSGFIQSSILAPEAGGSWFTFLALDDDATTFGADQEYMIRYNAYGAGLGQVTLFVNGVGIVDSAGLTATNNSRMSIVYDGVEVSGVVDGVKVVSVSAAPGQRLYPKVIDFYLSLSNLGYPIKDILYGPWSENAWASIGGANRPSDNAGTTLTFRPLDSFAKQQGNTLWKDPAAGLARWTDGNVVSQERYTGGASVSFRRKNGSTYASMTGLSSGIAAVQNYTVIDAAIYFTGSNTVEAYEYGSGYSTGYTVNDAYTYTVTYDGAFFRYTEVRPDGTESVLRISNARPGLSMRLHHAPFHPALADGSIGVQDVQLKPFTSNSNIPLIWDDPGAKYDISGTYVRRRPDAPLGWDTNAYSREGFRSSAYISGRLGTVESMLGLTVTKSGNYNSMTYLWYRTGSNAYVWYPGSGFVLISSSVDDSTIFGILYDGVRVVFYLNGALATAQPSAFDYHVYACICLPNPGSYASDIIFNPGIQVARIGANGYRNSDGSLLTQAELETLLGYAAGFIGMGPLATVTPPLYAGNTAAFAALGAGKLYRDSSDSNITKTTYDPSGGSGAAGGSKILTDTSNPVSSNNTTWVVVNDVTFANLPVAGRFKFQVSINAGVLSVSGLPFNGNWRLRQGGTVLTGGTGSFSADNMDWQFFTSPNDMSYPASIATSSQVTFEIQRADGTPTNFSGLDSTMEVTWIANG